MSTKAFDPHTKAQPGDTGSRAATSATIGASIRLLKSVLRIAGSRVSAKASAKSGSDLSSSRSSSLNSTSPKVLEESSSATGTGSALAFLYRIMAMSGTAPEPAPIKSTGGPRPEKVSVKRPAKLDRVAYLGDVVEERGDLAVQEALDRQLDHLGIAWGRGDRVAADGRVAVGRSQPHVNVLSGCVVERFREAEKEALDGRRSRRDLDNRA